MKQPKHPWRGEWPGNGLSWVSAGWDEEHQARWADQPHAVDAIALKLQRWAHTGPGQKVLLSAEQYRHGVDLTAEARSGYSVIVRDILHAVDILTMAKLMYSSGRRGTDDEVRGMIRTALHDMMEFL